MMRWCLRHVTVGALVMAAGTSCQNGSGQAGAGGADAALDDSGAGGTATGGTATGGMSTGGGAAGGATASGGTTPSGGSTATGGVGATEATGGASSAPLPCDVLREGGNQCVAAHSTVRVLVSGYSGSLYQLTRSDGLSRDIGISFGLADISSHESFCWDMGSCDISIIYDQSGLGNDLIPTPASDAKPTADKPAAGMGLILLIGGRLAYGVRIQAGIGYRTAAATGTATGDEPQTVYMVTSQRDLAADGCGFEYGNAATTGSDAGGGAEAVYFGMNVTSGTGVEGGPWVMADLGNGLFAGWENGQDKSISSNTPLAYDFVTAVIVGDAGSANGGNGRFALYGGDATTGTLKMMYDGTRPALPGYVPMTKTGAVALAIAGANSDSGGGRFYEGVMASGAASQATLDALQAAIVAAQYGQ